MIRSNVLFLFFITILFCLFACDSAEEDMARRAAAAQQLSGTKTKPDGMAVFRQRCITCHGAEGNLGLNGAKDLSKSTLSIEERVNIITHGKSLMTPFGSILSPEEIQAAAEYTLTLKK